MISFGDIPNELILHILTDLIYSKDFPSNLKPFSLVNYHGYTLARDKQIWRHAIRTYFPIVETLSRRKEYFFNDLFKSDPHLLFKNCYQWCQLLLQNEGLSFSDYIQFLNHNAQNTIDGKQLPVLIGLARAVGHTRAIDPNLMSTAKNQAIVFSAVYGHKTLLIQLMNENPPPEPQFKRRAFVIAAERGFLPISAYMMAHAQALLDRTTLCDAFIKAAAHGHLHVVQLFMKPPTSQVVTFALTKALNLACTHGHSEVAAVLVQNPFLHNNKMALCDSARAAVAHNHAQTLAILLQQTLPSKSPHLMLEIFKTSVEKRNTKMVETILTHAQVNFSLLIILERIEKAMSNGDEATAKTILTLKMQEIPPYARRKLFLFAAEKGLTAIVTLLWEASPKVFSADQVRQAFKMAQANQNEALFEFLKEKAGALVEGVAFKGQAVERAVADLDSLLHAFSKVTIEEVPEHVSDQLHLVQFGQVQRTIDTIENRINDNTQIKNHSPSSLRQKPNHF